MRRLILGSGAVAALLLFLLLTEWAGADSRVSEALRQGNAEFTSGEYAAALALFEAGLESGADSKALRFNAAQAAYLLGDYAKAAEHYEHAEDHVDKYLNAGNIFFRAGDAAGDANEQARCYAQALAIYREGIEKYPQNIPLKYNYETVLSLLQELTQEMEQQGENGEQGESDEQSENGEQGESDEQSESGGQSEQSQSGENAEGEQQEGSEQGESAESNQNTEQAESAGQQEQSEQNRSEAREGGQEAYGQAEGKDAPDQEAVERILAMLSSQEEESLKNNQNVVGEQEEAYGW